MNKIINQNESVLQQIREGESYGSRIPKKSIMRGLELETLVKNTNKIQLCDSFSEFGCSYLLWVKINNPSGLKSVESSDWNGTNYDRLMEVVPTNKGYNIKDYRLLNEVSKIKPLYNMDCMEFNNVMNLSLSDLVERLFSDSLSLSLKGMIKVKGVRSSVEFIKENEEHTIENLIKYHKDNQMEQYFDVDRLEIKNELLNIISETDYSNIDR